MYTVHYKLNGKMEAMRIRAKNEWNAIKRFEKKYPTIFKYAVGIFATN